jgi:hypothetical protein
MHRQRRIAGVDGAGPDAGAEIAIERFEIAVRPPKKRPYPEQFGGVFRRTLFQLPRDDGQRIRRDTGMKRGVALKLRDRAGLDERLDRFDQLDGAGLIHHVGVPLP